MPIAKFLHRMFSLQSCLALTLSCAYHQETDDDILSLQERLAAYNFESSGEKSAGKYFYAEIVKCSESSKYFLLVYSPVVNHASTDDGVFIHSHGN